jgi:hypothetical protein
MMGAVGAPICVSMIQTAWTNRAQPSTTSTRVGASTEENTTKCKIILVDIWFCFVAWRSSSGECTDHYEFEPTYGAHGAPSSAVPAAGAIEPAAQIKLRPASCIGSAGWPPRPHMCLQQPSVGDSKTCALAQWFGTTHWWEACLAWPDTPLGTPHLAQLTPVDNYRHKKHAFIDW